MVFGVTGHQDLIDELTKTWVKTELLRLIDQYKPLMGLSALAIGADQLFTACLIEKGISFKAVIPCQNYEQTFSKETLEPYCQLKEKAKQLINLNYEEPNEEAFWEAGKYIADQSDLLFAVWNGKPAKGWGGTGDVVQYAIESKVKVIHINLTQKETSILTP